MRHLPGPTPPHAPGCALGLDVGGTKMAAGLVASDGAVLEKLIVPTLPQRGGKVVLREALALAQRLLRHAEEQRWTVEAIGIGVCELVDLQGRVQSDWTVQWRGLPVQERFAALRPAWVDADSRAAAHGEARSGAGLPFGSFLYVTIGTGIGGSWVTGKTPFAGATGCTGTLASSPTAILCPDCGVIRRAVLEEVASGSALVRRYNARSAQALHSAKEVVAAAARGDAAADWVINTAVESLGATLGLLVGVLDPEAVIVGGGLGTAPGVYWERLIPAIRQHIWSDVHRGLPILQAARGADSGMVGAALLAWTRIRA